MSPARDAPRLDGRLRLPHVACWWGNPDAALEDPLRRSPESCALVLWDEVPVGYLHWHALPQAAMDAAGLARLPGDFPDIDIMTGEPTALDRGVGCTALGLLLKRVTLDPAVSSADVGTSARPTSLGAS